MTTSTLPISPIPTALPGAPPRTTPHAPLKRRNEPNPLTRAIAATLPPIPPLDPFLPNEPTPAPRSAPPRTTAHHSTRTNETNPTSPLTSSCLHVSPSPLPTPPQNSQNEPTPLPPAQLAALRLLLAGHRPGSVAASLAIDRHTLLRWRRSPPFAAELLRLHTQLLSPH